MIIGYFQIIANSLVKKVSSTFGASRQARNEK